MHKEYYSKLVKADINGKDKVLFFFFSPFCIPCKKKKKKFPFLVFYTENRYLQRLFFHVMLICQKNGFLNNFLLYVAFLLMFLFSNSLYIIMHIIYFEQFANLGSIVFSLIDLGVSNVVGQVLEFLNCFLYSTLYLLNDLSLPFLPLCRRYIP